MYTYLLQNERLVKLLTKIDVPISITRLKTLNHTQRFERYVVWCGLKNKCHKDMCLKDNGMCPQCMIIILVSKIDIFGGTIMTIQ